MKKIIPLLVVMLMLISGCTPSQTTSSIEGSMPAWVPEKWDYEADVVICGFGAAGAMGAKEAISNGASCLVLEKAPEKLAGGAASVSGGYVIPSTAEELFTNSLGYLTKDTAKALETENIKNVEWLKSCGMTLVNSWGKAFGSGSGYYKVLSEAVKASGANVMYETAAKKLIFDPTTNEVFGVIAEDAAGKKIYIKANKGVLLATGDMSGNPDLVDRLWLPNDVKAISTNTPYNTGDGFYMAMDVNAALYNITPMGLDLTSFSLRKASEEIGTSIQVQPDGEYAGAKIFVNGQGNRFMNEDTNLGHYKGVRKWLDYPGDAQFGYEGYVNQPMYMVFDSKFLETTSLSSPSLDNGWAAAKGIYNWSTDNKAELKRGWIAQGKTLEELVTNLAQQSGQPEINIDNFKKTVADYNKICKSGSDDVFGRMKPMPVDNAPYYAVELSTTLLYTIGGLQSGPNGETLNWNGEHIPGLYHAGDIGQTSRVKPQGVTTAMTYGALAVRKICTSESRTIPGAVDQVIKPHTPEQQQLANKGVKIDMSNYVTPAEAALGIKSTSTTAGKSLMTAGTYESTAKGNNGDIIVSVTVSDTDILKVVIKKHSETTEKGNTALKEIPSSIVDRQSLNIDGVSGATATGGAIVKAVEDCIQQAGGDPASWK